MHRFNIPAALLFGGWSEDISGNFELLVILANQKVAKVVSSLKSRGSGCSSLTVSTYTSAGSVFDIYCNSTWLSFDYLYLNYTTTFQSCMDGCVFWNTKHVQKCVGVSWSSAATGPDPSAGVQCWYYWEMNNTAYKATGTDSARLQPLAHYLLYSLPRRHADSLETLPIS